MINPKQAVEDAATHVEAPGAVQVWLTEAMVRHWQADALEAAALAVDLDPNRYRSETTDQYDCDCADAIRKLKETQ